MLDWLLWMAMSRLLRDRARVMVRDRARLMVGVGVGVGVRVRVEGAAQWSVGRVRVRLGGRGVRGRGSPG